MKCQTCDGTGGVPNDTGGNVGEKWCPTCRGTPLNSWTCPEWPCVFEMPPAELAREEHQLRFVGRGDSPVEAVASIEGMPRLGEPLHNGLMLADIRADEHVPGFWNVTATYRRYGSHGVT